MSDSRLDFSRYLLTKGLDGLRLVFARAST